MLIVLTTLLMAARLAGAADLDAGKEKVATVCAACHGATGVSVSDTIPNLAAQRAIYIQLQLRALKAGTRKNPIMNPIAAQLSAEDIANVAAYFAAQPGAATAAKSAFLPNLARSGVTFPENYKTTFTKYYTINLPATKRVHYFYANNTALQAAKGGKALPNGSVLFVEIYSAKRDAHQKPITGSDGFFMPDQLLFYTVMAREAGWGKDFPQMLRNEDWNYGAFNPAMQPLPVNQAECLACHKPLQKASFTFTLKQLTAVAKSK